MASSNAPEPINLEAVTEVQRNAPPEELLRLVVETFEALADPTRARILYALIRRPLCVRDLAIIVGVSESAISHQMRYLRERHIVNSRRIGNAVEYSVDDVHVAALFREAEYHADHVRQGIPDHPYRVP